LFVFALGAFAGITTALLHGEPAQSAPRHEYQTVRYVIDGDSVVLVDRRQVRLIGINAPELGKDGKAAEPAALAARDFLVGLVAGKRVRVDYESEERDRHGRWLAHLETEDGRSVEQAMLEAGLAFAISIPPNIGQQDRLFRAEQVARRAQRGVWREPYFAPREADGLSSTDGGFRFIRGRIARIGRSRTSIYLELAPHISIRVRHVDWLAHFPGKPESWLGASIHARGWIAVHGSRLHMTIGHPRMIERQQ